MDHAWAIEKLDDFIEGIDKLGDWVRLRSQEEALVRKEIVVRQIANEYVQGLGDYTVHLNGSKQRRWGPAREAAMHARELAAHEDEFDAFRRARGPGLAADAFHPWVWGPASALWAAQAHQDAVLTAARTVNRRLQQKLGRHDIGEMDLCMQSFDPKPPTEGKPRLRFEGARDTPKWKARQDGAKYLSAGAFLGIRNLAAHEEQVTWTQQEALEYLATFSVVARWIEECSVETAL
ncbi:TIGR02391 family protein [Streptomyces sp. NPDC057623]|uniref:TIGR02391 family protein n=1 Tax=Streptomyces sp. NPDC057623 TaxID=3346187 RepID=UPI0036C67B99